MSHGEFKSTLTSTAEITVKKHPIKSPASMLFSSTFIKFTALVLATRTAASPVVVGIEPQARRVCYDETPALHCYSGGSDIPQNVNETDVSYIAASLRAYGRQTKLGRLLTMTTADAPDCGEWFLYSRNSAAAYAKKIDMTYNSSVLFEEIANTIDGGTGVVKQAGIFRCRTDGGSYGVQVNATAPAYTTKEYIEAGLKPSGIIIKIVANK
ncbi:hypothetical protein GX48_00100 [Paracoccidioides brasiliensis]|nr:hypothetical protein GX48_00100 [Paracoccidioides brasiliensis]